MLGEGGCAAIFRERAMKTLTLIAVLVGLLWFHNQWALSESKKSFAAAVTSSESSDKKSTIDSLYKLNTV